MSKHQIKKEHLTTNWAGGKTTELYIYPEDSHYKTGDFLFRISTASIEIEESVFTQLPEVERTLMVLEGQVKLIHKNHHTKVLKPLDSDQFLGEWETNSVGKCIDFNLMCKSGTKGKVKGYNYKENTEHSIKLDGKINFIFLYKGLIEFNDTRLTDSDLLIIKSESLMNKLKALEQSQIVVIYITEVNLE
ncbi:HutD family protein [Marinigracilibium pacificum]|uniref:HutD protein n=1 Tax=Marinigracilibium pacificum TaxID=2729599 RepID=A0A848J0B8_9BACT|nr:HutD family protein [Marinigracilibium pacificum]NMM47709.1 hypothetical protein [Marinigracilibium pacificum]